ncbi:unnamed protein product [Rotaria magnacalcarata]|uniref:NAD(P)-binding domain-containing protein n=1 Tax=Rotaria magnacalcarata TaxID=392030 RepID=A0A820HKJ2_9BILA|nr:unnamed protein product [Rotaria magnacalcarata]
MLPNARRDCVDIDCFWMGVLVYSHILSLYTPTTKNSVQISSDKNNVFAVRASGNVGSDVIDGLVRKGVETTAYVRNEKKARELFKDELATGLLSIVVGTYTSIDIYARANEGHDRLFILVSGGVNKPVSMSKIKEIFGKIAYERRVRQIVDVSSYNVRIDGIQCIIRHMHTTSEDKLLALAETNSDERSLVILNISECAAAVLTEPVEKHDRSIYEAGAEVLSNEQRAKIFDKVLGTSIMYEQQTIEDFYKTNISSGMNHSFAYDLIKLAFNGEGKKATLQLAVILNPPLRTFEEWLQDNIQLFQ